MIDITLPTKGSVTIDLPYEEAEVLLRAVGLVNSGNLNKVAPKLANIVERLVIEFGRNLEHEAVKYMSDIRDGQVYIEEAYC